MKRNTPENDPSRTWNGTPIGTLADQIVRRAFGSDSEIVEFYRDYRKGQSTCKHYIVVHRESCPTGPKTAWSVHPLYVHKCEKSTPCMGSGHYDMAEKEAHELARERQRETMRGVW